MAECSLSASSPSLSCNGVRLQCERSSLDLINLKDAKFNLRADKNVISHEEKMLARGDCDLNPADSIKEVLKQTMLSQDNIFRKQVLELHRLYQMQKILMKDFGWKECDAYNLGKASTQSTLRPIAIPTRYESMGKENTFAMIPTVGATKSRNNDCLQRCRGIYSGFKQRRLDLQLPASHYIDHVGEDFSKKGNDSVETKHYFPGDSVSSPEVVRLSLSIGGDTRNKVGGRNWGDNITLSSSQHVDSGDLSRTIYNGDAEPMSALDSAAPIAYSGDDHDSQISVQPNRSFTNNMNKDLSHGIKITCSLSDDSKSCLEQNSFHQGLKEFHGVLPCNKKFSKGKLVTSYEAAELDLNRVQLDESSSYLNDTEVAYPSTGSPSGIFHGPISNLDKGTCPAAFSWGEPNSNHFNKTSALLRPDSVNPMLVDSNSVNNSRNILSRNAANNATSGSKACPIDIESISRPSSDLSEDCGNHSKNSGHKTVDLRLNVPNEYHTGLVTPDVNGEKCNEDILSSHLYRIQDTAKDAHCTPASSKLDCVADDNSSSIKTTQSGTDVGESNLSPFFHNAESSQVAETPCQQDARDSDNNDLKRQCYGKKERKSPEVDVLIQKAAISLIYISLGSSGSNQGCIAKTGSTETENDGREEPQCSTDSYESIVLKLTESCADDYCVSSKPFEINEMDAKECGIKLRRGRRLKDFQRDILPGLASLSRHEICEDINIMEGVIRSREYKKLRSKMANGGNLFAPVRSRRSRLNYVGRRYYS